VRVFATLRGSMPSLDADDELHSRAAKAWADLLHSQHEVWAINSSFSRRGPPPGQFGFEAVEVFAADFLAAPQIASSHGELLARALTSLPRGQAPGAQLDGFASAWSF